MDTLLSAYQDQRKRQNDLKETAGNLDPEIQDWLAHGVSTQSLADKYPAFFPSARALYHHWQHRKKNGLLEADAVRKSRGRNLVWHEIRVMRWALGQR